MAIEVVPYRAEWAMRFEDVASVIRPAVADLPGAQVEHVGSTSVPGLAAKPILDVDVVVAPDDLPRAVRALEALGYRHRGDLGVTGREAFHPPRTTTRPATSTPVPPARSTCATTSPSARCCARAPTCASATAR